MSSTIELTDVGPIEHLSIPVPEDGGIVVLRGSNGTGKSTALRATERLATGKKDLAITARDGSNRGSVSGCGVTLRVSKSITRTGELECESLDGRLSVAELVDPGLKGAEEADARRIRALVQLAGVKPDVSMFASLLDSKAEFDSVVKGKNLETDDILVLSDRIKRAIEEAARNAEGVANVEKAKAAACKEAASGVDTGVETNQKVLQEALEAAFSAEIVLAGKAEEAQRRNSEIRQASDKIKALGVGNDIATVKQRTADAFDEMMTASAALENKRIELTETVAKLEAEIKQLQHESELADQRWNACDRELKNAEKHERELETLTEVVSAGEIVGPTDEELAAAEQAVAQRRQAIEQGALARRAIESLEKAKRHFQAEMDSLTKAETLREAAKRVDDVLSEQIAKLGVALQVKNSRLVTKTRRGMTNYADLSDGERWKIAIDIATEAIGFEGLLFIPQPAYEALDPNNRKLIDGHLKSKKVVLLTAEATDGPIRAEIESEKE